MRARHSMLLLAPLVVGCASSTTAESQTQAPAAATAATTAKAGKSCVPITQIQESRVIDDQTIDFHIAGGAVLRNRLPYPCSQLGFEKAFSYSTSLSQLCSTDIITVIHTGGGPRRGASCGLGQFVPYTPPPAS